MIRRADVSDIGALHRLIETAYRGDTARTGWSHEADLLDGQRIDPEALDDILTDASQSLLLAKQDDADVGCVCVSDRGSGLAYLGLLTVAPERQAGGIGRALLAAGEAEAHARFGATRIEMTVIIQRVELIQWYRRRGYRETGETRPFPVDDARFGLPLRDDLCFVVLERRL